MIGNFKSGGWETEVRYTIQFFVDRDGGYAFPCDKDGTLLPGMEEAAKKNYAWCLEHPDKFPFRFNEVVREEYRYRVPNSGTCACGHELELTNDYMGACQCPECGQWYSLSGQELLPPEEWGWDGCEW